MFILFANFLATVFWFHTFIRADHEVKQQKRQKVSCGHLHWRDSQQTGQTWRQVHRTVSEHLLAAQAPQA